VHGPDRSAAVAACVDAIDARTTSQTNFIMAALVRGAWPGGIADRLETAALEWVRRWGPDGSPPDYAAALTAGGAACN